MFQTMTSAVVAPADPFPFGGLPSAKDLIEMGLNYLNVHGSPKSTREFAQWHNELQRIAKSTGYGIPITLSTDPRHAFSDNPMTAMNAGVFSQWPESLGLIALRDEKINEEYADIVRQEYKAVGIRAALHPQIDLSTEYRWSRISNSFGEDADLASKLVTAQLKGLQGGTFGKDSISCCVKHFPGGGPELNGYDCHFAWGKEQIYPGGNFDYHLKPFEASFAAGARFVMPSYGVPMGTKYKEVAFAFNEEIITDLLRKEMGFKGIVVSDWAIIKGMPELGDMLAPKCYGMESASIEDRLVACLNAGVDQFGGEYLVDELAGLVEIGRVPESRLDRSCLPLLMEKFELGLFDNPFVDEDAAEKIVVTPNSSKLDEMLKRHLPHSSQTRKLTVNLDPFGER